MIATPVPAIEHHVPFITLSGDEEELVKGIRARNEIKFKLLYHKYAPALMGIISRIAGSRVVAEDILQESFVKILNSIESYDPSRGRLFTWMAATARHKAIDHLRSKTQLNASKNLNIEEFSFESESRHQTTINADTIGIKNLTEALPLAERQILNLIYFQGYTHSEAAEMLNIPLGTVKTRLRRAISALRRYF